VRLFTLFLILLIPATVAASDRRIPITVNQRGSDQVGSLFATAFNRELSHSTRYGFAPSGVNPRGVEFYVDIISADAAVEASEKGKRSIISLVIQEMGLPNSYPVSTMWYHKVISVDRQTVDKSAKDFLYDIDASFCNYGKNSVGGCPKEKFQSAP
jgi:hypothetical protein